MCTRKDVILSCCALTFCSCYLMTSSRQINSPDKVGTLEGTCLLRHAHSQLMNYPFSKRHLACNRSVCVIVYVHLTSGQVRGTNALFFTSLDLSGMLQGKIQVGYSSNAENAAARKAFLVSIVSGKRIKNKKSKINVNK